MHGVVQLSPAPGSSVQCGGSGPGPADPPAGSSRCGGIAAANEQRLEHEDTIRIGQLCTDCVSCLLKTKSRKFGV